MTRTHHHRGNHHHASQSARPHKLIEVHARNGVGRGETYGVPRGKIRASEERAAQRHEAVAGGAGWEPGEQAASAPCADHPNCEVCGPAHPDPAWRVPFPEIHQRVCDLGPDCPLCAVARGDCYDARSFLEYRLARATA